MLISSDDEIYQVDQVFLGPDRFRLPWRATYRAYAVFFVAAMAVLGLERQLAIPVGLWSVAYGLLIALGLTRAITRFLDHDRPLRGVLRELVLELSGPRENTTPTRLVWRARRMRAARRARPTVTDDDPAPRERRTSWWTQFRPHRRTGPTSSPHQDPDDAPEAP